MNLVDCYVTKVLGKPIFKYNHFFVPVEYDSYGRISTTEIMYETLEEAESIEIGYQFLS